MRRATLSMVVAALLLVSASAAGAAPPPGFPAGNPLGPPITLPFPAPGKVSFFSVAVSGHLKPGKTMGKLTPIAYGHPSPNERLAGGMTKPKTTAGKTTFTFYFAIKNIGTKRVLSQVGIAPPAQVDVFGNPVVWVDVGFGPPVKMTCAEMKKYFAGLAFFYAIYSFGDTPAEMWRGALSSCP
ncbi:MAG TPA: hypothetical protein VGG88_08405 [Gaiellaceae bacterium]